LPQLHAREMPLPARLAAAAVATRSGKDACRTVPQVRTMGALLLRHGPPPTREREIWSLYAAAREHDLAPAVDHLSVDGLGATRVGCNDPAGSLDLALSRREGRIDRSDLLRVDAQFACVTAPGRGAAFVRQECRSSRPVVTPATGLGSRPPPR
jgi:hypothetical protein